MLTPFCSDATGAGAGAEARTRLPLQAAPDSSGCQRPSYVPAPCPPSPQHTHAHATTATTATARPEPHTRAPRVPAPYIHVGKGGCERRKYFTKSAASAVARTMCAQSSGRHTGTGTRLQRRRTWQWPRPWGYACTDLAEGRAERRRRLCHTGRDLASDQRRHDLTHDEGLVATQSIWRQAWGEEEEEEEKPAAWPAWRARTGAEHGARAALSSLCERLRVCFETRTTTQMAESQLA